MNIIFYIAAIVAILSTVMVITQTHTVHALLYMIVSILSISVIFFVLGAPFLAALEIIIYGSAIMILFIFVAMMLNLGKENEKQEKEWLNAKAWVGPGILTLILLIEFIYITATSQPTEIILAPIGPKAVGTALYTEYVLGVELTAMLLMSALIGAYHIGNRKQKEYHRFLQDENDK